MNKFIIILLLLLSACHYPSFEEQNNGGIVIEKRNVAAHNEPYTVWHTVGDLHFPQTIDNWIDEQFYIKTSFVYFDKKGKTKIKKHWNNVSIDTYITYQIGDTIRYVGEYSSK